MRGKKSPMIMGLIGAMLLSTNAFAAVPSDFSDFPTDWSAPAMTHAVQNGLLNGSDGKILPKGLLTRAQMATMVNRAFASSAKASLTSFTDMLPGVWHYDEMAKSVQMGAFQGADGKLNPNDPITREQAFAVLARAFGLADGKASSLDKFSDGAQVSSWARGAVAALVEQGYVTGADGALNPQSYITRAEFAQVMDALVAAYGDQDLKDQTVEGNLILRTNSTLENVTVKGDLILADGVSAASLKNVTVTGRLVVRGGTDGVKLTKSTAKGGIRLANPNGTPKLTIDGKAYHPNGTTNGGASNSGGGSSSGGSSGGGSSSSSGSSSSGGNSSTQTDLVVADQTKLVNVDWGQYVAVRFTSGNNLSNCTLTVDGTVVNDACSNVTTDGSIVKWESTTWNPAKLVITKGSQSQTVTLSQTANPATPTAGQKADAYYFLANGPVYVWDYHLTNYDESGAVRYSPKVTTFSLTNEEQDAIKFYSPEAVLQENVENSGNRYGVKGEVELMFNYAKGTDAEKAWVDGIATTGAVQLVAANENNNSLNKNLDYTLNTAYPHGTDGSTVACITVPLGQDNFYSNGRYQLRVTSNGKSKLFPVHVVNETAPSMILTDTAAKSGQNVHFQVENMTYGITQPIYRVELTTPKGETTELAKIDDWYLIGDTFILYNDNTNHIQTNGKYTLTVYADGFKTFTKDFNVSGGESLIIQKAALPYGIDTYSGSSLSGGSSGSGSGSEGGSNTMNAYIIFKADLLINAKIMTELKTNNDYASAIAERWDDMTSKVSVYAEGASDTYSASHYFDAANTARSTKPLTFAAYVASDSAQKYTRGTPYAVKQVLEDNLLGETTTFSETSNKAAPDISLVKLVEGKYVAASEVTQGEDAVFQCLDKAYLAKLAENGSIYKGTASNSSFTKDTDYTINTEKGLITINHSKLTVGDNSITIKVNGYQTVRLSVPYQKVLEAVNLSVPVSTEAEDPVVITCNTTHDGNNCDFFDSLTEVTLTGPGMENGKKVMSGTSESVHEDLGYTISGNTLTLGKDLFKTAGEYSVTLKAGYGYETQTVKLTITPKAEVPDQGEELTPPQVAEITKETAFGDSYYRVSFSGDAEAYLKKLSDTDTVTVNGEACTLKISFSWPTASKEFKVIKDNGVAKYIDFTTDCFGTGETIVSIKVAGYSELAFKVQDGKLVTGGDSGTTDPEITAAPTTAPTISQKSNGSGNNYYAFSFGTKYANWVSKISGVTLGSTTYSEKDSVDNLNSDNYCLDAENGTVALRINSFSLPGDMVISVNGGESLTLRIERDGSTIKATVKETTAPGGSESGDNSGEQTGKDAPVPTKSKLMFGSYTIDFGYGNDSYINGITKIIVNNQEYSTSYLSDYRYSSLTTDGTVTLTNTGFTQNENTVVISSTGYKDLTLTIMKDGSLKN